ncbi:hypothetical protein HJC23_011371 [Cyclotella cryptica]|uniref:Uncharacterized protein n=1 Tax=Cyclotella cryptica TaxID=29204 RepID=A0ABD3PP83_9STRA|eukprot:CCRYP_012663-RA/>CCRYP_012663-RA protein AED:0.00 eAED:0.00 QI:166/-1/1/1/-1/1/1/263/348
MLALHLLMAAHLSALFVAGRAIGKSSKPSFVGSRFGCLRPIQAIPDPHDVSRSSPPNWKSWRISVHVPHSGWPSTRLFSVQSSRIKLSTESTSDAGNATSESQPFTWKQLVQLFRTPSQNRHFVPSDHPNLTLFRRSSAVQSTYLAHQTQLKLRWKSAYDYLCVHKFGREFGFQSTLVKTRDDGVDGDCVPESGQESRYQSEPSLVRASDYAIKNKRKYLSLVPNDYPYDVDVGIDHYCLWKIGGTFPNEGILEDEMKWAITELEKCSAEDFHRSSLIVQQNDVEYYATMNTASTCDEHGIVDYLYWVNPPHLQSMPKIQHAHILVLRGENRNNGHMGDLTNPLSSQL